jgi:hypothetical protein
VRGLGSRGVGVVVEERTCGGAYAVLKDFIRRASQQPDLPLLIRAGAFDLADLSRRQLLQEGEGRPPRPLARRARTRPGVAWSIVASARRSAGRSWARETRENEGPFGPGAGRE